MKKKIFISFFFFCAIIVIFCFFYIKSFQIKQNLFCPFCDEKIINYQKYFENENVLGLCSYKPLLKGHSLIIPKRHIERFEELNEIEIKEIFQLIKKTNLTVQKILNNSSYILIQKNGKEVGQSVSHVHFHYIPRNEGSNFGFLIRFLLYPFKRKLKPSDMHQITNLISENI